MAAAAEEEGVVEPDAPHRHRVWPGVRSRRGDPVVPRLLEPLRRPAPRQHSFLVLRDAVASEGRPAPARLHAAEPSLLALWAPSGRITSTHTEYDFPGRNPWQPRSSTSPRSRCSGADSTATCSSRATTATTRRARSSTR